MKKIILVCFILFCSEEIFSQQNLIVDEEFSDSTLNTNLWQTQFPWGPGGTDKDENKNLEIDMPYNVVVNNGLKLILQYQPGCYNTWRYCDANNCNPNCTVAPSPSCASLPINCQVQGDHCLCLVPKYFDYTSGIIYSNQSYQFGTFEMKCKIPDYTYPAFWLYGEQCEEIDIFEFEDCNATKFNTTIHKCDGKSNNLQCIQRFTPGSDYSQEFHIFRLEWTESNIKMIVDGELLYHCTASGIFNSCLYYTTGKKDGSCVTGTKTLFPNHPMNLIVSIARNADCTPVSPAEMDIQYIRIWSDVSQCNVIAPNPCSGKFQLTLSDQSTEQKEIFIYNVLGQIIYQFQVVDQTSQIDLSAQPKGIYFVKVKSPNKICTNKVIIL